ncbi:unnamed protein product [Schistosoma curassoni]|uniref:DDE_Tnp_1_7 domain-containing protein n=1 Tax=Schistosoma curassoni TaxID=6186 RepID=A0A183KT20_9TREM|nr:unnamed protein product [Schistosoma curassoni]
MLLYSGHDEENVPYTQGVVLMPAKESLIALMGWESHGSRIIKASYRTNYAPSNDINDNNEDHFYEKLQSIIAKCPRMDLTILMGDLKAKVGMDDNGYEDMVQRHRLGEKNENGKRFSNQCAFHKVVAGGSIFSHKRIHKTTWVSPDHITENHIDHNCINKIFRRTMRGMRMRRGAEMASDYHRLVVANMKLKLKKHCTTGQTALQSFDTDLLRHTDKLNQFKITLNNRFPDLQELLKEAENTMEGDWEEIKQALTSTCQEITARKKHHHEEWISMETLDKIQERKENMDAAINNNQARTKKVMAQAEYTGADKLVEKNIIEKTSRNTWKT